MKKLIYVLAILIIGGFTFAKTGKPNKTLKLDPANKKAYVYKSLLNAPDSVKQEVLDLIPKDFTVIEKPR